MKLALIGNYGATNVGDDAILSCLLESLLPHQVTVFSAHPEQTHRQFKVLCAPLFPLGIRSVLKLRFFPAYKALKATDAAILGGGGLFQDDTLYACFLWAWQVFWVKRLKKPLFIYATGVGPLNSRLGRWLTRWAYRNALGITVRDEASKKTLLNLGFKENKVHLTADPTFLFPLPPAQKKPEKKQLFISLRPWRLHDSKLIGEMIDFLSPLKEQGWDFTFVAMQSIKEKDQTLLKTLISKIGGKLFIPEHFSALLEKMSQADVAIGMRYHFLIAARLTQTPFIAIAYSPKVSELVQGSLLEPYLFPIKKVSSSRLHTALENLIHHYIDIQHSEIEECHQWRKRAEESQGHFQSFIKTIDLNQKG